MMTFQQTLCTTIRAVELKLEDGKTGMTSHKPLKEDFVLP